MFQLVPKQWKISEIHGFILEVSSGLHEPTIKHEQDWPDLNYLLQLCIKYTKKHQMHEQDGTRTIIYY